MASQRMYALTFIYGKYQGGEFPLHPDREIVVGRSSDLDVVLVEDMVSRKHAKISTAGDQVVISDLGSTNGTFVNGNTIKKMVLKEGDRILIGTSIIMLTTVDPASVMSPDQARQKLEQTGQRKAANPPNRSMSGTIDEIPLPDLMQLLSTSRKSGVLTVRSPEGVGKLFLRKGQLVYASIDDRTDLPPRKSLFRLLTWTQGTFELEPAPTEEQTFPSEMEESTEGLLMEGMRQLDELRRLEETLPARNSVLGLSIPLTAPLRDLTPSQLDTLQSVINYGTLSSIFDHSPSTDLDTAEALVELLKKNYLAPRD
jgi:pSer/pThr/pTyr-binding forkhead associated (FHA) protein